MSSTLICEHPLHLGPLGDSVGPNAWAALFCGGAANASVIITLDQLGPNVVATASGTVNLTDLTPPTFPGNSGAAAITPNAGLLALGEATAGSPEFPNITTLSYSGISGPRSFGTCSSIFFTCEGTTTVNSTSTGNQLSLNGAFEVIGVPLGYESGAELSSMATWADTTIAALGATPGRYTWTWGTGENADSLTLFVIPEPSTWPLLATSLTAPGVVAYCRRKSAGNAR